MLDECPATDLDDVACVRFGSICDTGIRPKADFVLAACKRTFRT